MKICYSVISRVEVEADFEAQRSTVKQCEVDLIASDHNESAWKNTDGVVNELGLKVQTQGLIQGLIANIHYAHQHDMWDSAEHLRYIIDYLEQGFVTANTTTTTGEGIKI